MANVTYYELGNYNGGRLIAKTFELERTTHESHMEELQEWLEELTESTGEPCEEWIIADVEDVPSEYRSEWSIDEGFWDFMDACEEHDADIVKAASELGIPLDKIEDAYYGCFESDTELAEEYVESTGTLDEVPESIKNYFDFESCGRDLAYYFLEFNGHYFHGNW